MEKQNFYDLNFDHLKNFLTSKVEIDSTKAKMRAQQMFNAVYKKNIKSFEELTTFSLELREKIKKLISSKTKIIAITHISNVTGAIMPIKKIVDLAKGKNIPVLVDGTQGAPHLKIDIQELGCDFYIFNSQPYKT